MASQVEKIRELMEKKQSNCVVKVQRGFYQSPDSVEVCSAVITPSVRESDHRFSFLKENKQSVHEERCTSDNIFIGKRELKAHIFYHERERPHYSASDEHLQPYIALVLQQNAA